MNDILRPSAFQRLDRGLDSAIEGASHLEPVAEAIRTPLRQLRAVARETRATLHEHPKSMQRLALMLSSHAGRVMLQRHREHHTEGTDETGLPDHKRAHDCSPSIVHMGELVLLGLAAGRAGEGAGGEVALVQAVFGLASSALPAELLERALASGLQPSQLRTMLEGLDAKQRGEILLNAQVQTFLDPWSQARRECLVGLEQLVTASVGGWTNTDVRAIKAVSLQPGDKLMLSLHRETEGDDGVDLSGGLEAFSDGTARIVLASHAKPPVAVTASSKNKAKRTVTIELPADAQAGWVGLTDTSMRSAAKERRAAVASRWAGLNESCCLRHTPVDVDLIAGDDRPSIPERSPVGNWGSHILDLELSGSAEDMVPAAAGQPGYAYVWVGPTGTAERVEVSIDDTPIEVELERDIATASIPAAAMVSGAVVEAHVFSPNRGAPDDTRSILVEDPTAGEDATTAQETRRYVLVRPAVVSIEDGDVSYARVELPAAQSLRGRVKDRQGRDWSEVHPPWMDDRLMSLSAALTQADGARTDAMLDNLEQLAARCPGLEDAVWIAVVPRLAKTSAFMRHASSSIAAGLVVATPEGLDLAALPAPPALGPARSKALLIGHVRNDDVVLRESVRIESRRSADRGDYVTPFAVVGRDTNGVERVTRRIATSSPMRAGAFACAIPVDEGIARLSVEYRPEALAVELSASPKTVVVDLRPGITTEFPRTFAPLSVSRVPAAPALEDVQLGENGVRWRYRHPTGLPGRFDIEVAASEVPGAWSRLLSLSGACPHVSLASHPPGIAGSYDRVRVVACDGWNTVVAEVDGTPDAAPVPVRIRRVRDGVFWADRDEASTKTKLSWIVRDENGVRTRIDHASAISIASLRAGEHLELIADEQVLHRWTPNPENLGS